MAKSRARRPGGRTPRTRRTAEQARRLILDAAEARLREGGPEALRLKDIARDAGISHPTILHHFESREGLVQALLLRGMDRLESALAAVVEAAPATPQTVTAATERIFAALGDAGHARLLAWRALEAGTPDPEREDPVLRRLADLVHARRAERAGIDASDPALSDDTDFLMRLTAAATLGDAIFGPFIDCWLGHDGRSEGHRSFRTRFAKLLFERLLATPALPDPSDASG